MSPAPLPRYKCHKEVCAVKIAAIEQSPAKEVYPGGSYRIIPVDEGVGPLLVGTDFIDKHKPEVGGYFVVYEDGYQSFSPAQAFEEGYTRI